jgi:hypothetical protein
LSIVHSATEVFHAVLNLSLYEFDIHVGQISAKTACDTVSCHKMIENVICVQGWLDVMAQRT